MKQFLTQGADFYRKPGNRRNLKFLLWLLTTLFFIVAAYSVIFQLLSRAEGREFSWVTSVYWTLTVMSTLGFGDITFTGDVGRIFSIWVLITGTLFMLILLPFTLVQFFYLPWIEAQAAARAPRRLPQSARNHVILTHPGPVSSALIRKLFQFGHSYVLLAPSPQEAEQLTEAGLSVVVGQPDDPEILRRVLIDKAALVAITSTDVINTKVAFTARQESATVPIIATVRNPAAVDILELSGCSRVLELCEMLGQALARVVHGGNTAAHVIGQFDELHIAEATATGTPLIGKSLEEAGLRRKMGITVIGIWEQGQFLTARPDTRVHGNTVLVLAGSRSQLDAFDDAFRDCNVATGPAVVLGGGRVGRATARALAKLGLDYRIVEQLPERIRDPEKYVLGDASDLFVLKQAGIMETSTVVITTHDDDVNIYLTIYCRRLRPDVQIISRSNLEPNVLPLHRAGADFVLSYAAMGANAILHFLRHGDSLMIAEGLDVFKVPVPKALIGTTIAASGIRSKTGCTVVALNMDGETQVNPDPLMPFGEAAEIVMIGDTDAEMRFFEVFP